MSRRNPATEQQLDSIATHDEEAVDAALDRSVRAGRSWAQRSLRDRCQLLEAVGSVLRAEIDSLGATITEEMGKPISEARSEIEKCAWVCDHYAESAPAYLERDALASEPSATTYVTHEPLGPVLAVMPWNFPFWQVFRFAAPALAAGNTALLKHASNVPGCSLAIERCFEQAGFPSDVFQSLIVRSERVEEIVGDDRVRGVTLTGSERAGRAVGSAAGKALKPSVLELGGSDPFIVLDDADVRTAARVGARARTINSGQSCIAAKRFVVHEAVYDDFLTAFVEAMAELSVGDPTDESTAVGPQARADLLETLDEQVSRTVAAGATLELGGEPLDQAGYFYPPTVVTDVPRDAPMATEEVFGPAAPVFAVESAAQAIELANDTPFGLGCSVWTDDCQRAQSLASQIEAGGVFVNELTKSDPRLPFGGIKRSGYGRELAEQGIKSFTNQKTVWISSP